VKDDWFACPHCGEQLPARARKCPECGSDRSTGWSPTAEEDSLELPEATSDEEHDEFLAREFPDQASPRRRRRRRRLVLFAITLALLFLIWATGAHWLF
jgi:predicted nucleic acid-binding Zn ribbon protein